MYIVCILNPFKISNAMPRYFQYITTKKKEILLNGFKMSVSLWVRRCKLVHLADHLNLLTLALVAKTDSGLPLTGGCLNAQASFHLH